MPKAIIELTTQQLVEALGIDVTAVHEVGQDFNGRVIGRVFLHVDADWAKSTSFGGMPLIRILEDVPLRINQQAKE